MSLNYGKMDFAVSFAPLTAFPLDSRSYFESYALAVEAAKNAVEAGSAEGTLYFGQIITVVENGIATQWQIQPNGTLTAIGGSVKADEATITSDNNDTISLRDYGKKFYKFIEATGSKEEGNYVEAHYELTEVSETNPWIEGLEPKVVSENGELVLGWFEPNLSTVEGINDQIAAIQSTVQDLKNATYTKTQTDTKISEAIAKADHLSRVIVKRLSEITTDYIEAADKDATKYIFMVPTGIEYDDDKYDEYIVIVDEETNEQVVERVGSWEIDLSGYVQKEEGSRLITTTEATKLENIAEGAEVNVINEIDTEVFTLEDRTLGLKNLPISKITDLQSALNNKVEKTEGYRLISDEEGTKLEGIETGAQVNVIQSVGQEFNIDENKNLTLLTSKILLSDNNDFITLQNKVVSLEGLLNGTETTIGLQTEINQIKDSIEGENGINAQIENLSSNIQNLSNTFVTTEIFNSTVGDINSLVHVSGKEDSTLIDEINDINERLTWGELQD